MYIPILPGTSLNSWSYLQESQQDQLTAFGAAGTLPREQENFVEKIVNMSSVEDLMNDYQALKVALGAHGLQDDLPNRYFVQQVIEQGTQSEDAFANRLSDARYTALAQTFETLGLTGTGDLSESLPSIDLELADAVETQFGESPIYLNAAAKLSNNLTLGLLGADSADNIWQRALENDGLAFSIGKMLGVSDQLTALDNEAQIDLLREVAEFKLGNSSLTALIDPDATFELADSYLGSFGSALSDAFSYTGLNDSLSSLNSAGADEDARWSALQADTATRDVIAQALGVRDALTGLDAQDQIAVLQDATKDMFGRSDFEVFTLQANVSQLGDRYLSPQDESLTQTFTLGGFTDAVSAVLDQGASVDEKWDSALSIDSFKTALAEAFALTDGFDALSDIEQRDALKAEIEARFGTDDVSALEIPENMATLTGLYMDAQISDITNNYVEQEFQVAVGDLRPELRVAMSVADELQAAIDAGGTDDGQWFLVLGSSVLRSAFETAFGLSTDFAQVDLDSQVTTMKEMSQTLIGSDRVADYLESDNLDTLINRYLTLAGTTDTSSSDPSVSLFSTASANSILSTAYGS